jgi:AcrR family transcriptional regulator
MPRRSDARQRMIESAALLFRERGVNATSFTDVLEHSGAPRGSIYHHFPGGKTELAEAATRWAGECILDSTNHGLATHDPLAAVDALARWWRTVLDRSDFQAGCVIAAAALEGDREPTVREAAAEAFEQWERALAGALTARGVPPQRARSLAEFVIAAFEGAVILARARRSTAPLDRVAEELRRAVAGALPDQAASGSS